MRAKIIAAVVAVAAAQVPAAVTDYVHPEIGTEFNGHTTVAAAYPFGLVQAGPDTGHGHWDYCSGYRHADTAIWGFSQTHLSGTGCADLGDIRIVPGGVDRAYPFDKASETAKPGYYGVMLKEVDTKVEVTVTPHAAIYRFTFEGDAPARILVDTQWMMTNVDNLKTCVLESESRPQTDGVTLLGRRVTKAWCTRALGWAIRTDRPWTLAKLPAADAREKGERLVLTFADVKKGETVTLKIGLSASGQAEKALANLTAEIPAWDFEAVRTAATAAWERYLSRMVAEGNKAELISFYTSLYHIFFQPNNIADVGETPYYSTFSTWDTFRAAHPLYTVIAPEMVQPFVDSMLKDQKKRGYTSVWTLWGEDTQCMIGTHSVPVIVDAILKGLWKGDVKRAYAAVKASVTENNGRGKGRFDFLDDYGYYPFNHIKGESVSRTLECAYDDWCVLQLARLQGCQTEITRFAKRAANWRNVFDPELKLMRGKDTQGKWREPFDPFSLGHGADTPNDFTEGNSYQYTWHVMQDPEGLIEAVGGKAAFAQRLERLFTLPSKVEGAGFVSDVSGLIGQYAHGNEPSHHTIYFFQYAGRPDLTAKYVRQVFDDFYLPKPDGLCGNDDCGQMSAWYLFSAAGFYPFNPCGGDYVLGAPQLPRIVFNLADGKRFTVTARNLSAANKYVKSVTLNGQPLDGFILKHAQIAAGGDLVFEMTDCKKICRDQK